jgi:protein-S-isoprenylcysteine O-methyltransferase Ste14
MLIQFSAADRPFALAFIVIYVTLMIIRLTFRASHHDIRRRLINPDEGIGNIVARWVLGTLLLAAIAAYFAAPARIIWSFLAVPDWLRVTGVAASVLCLGLLVWAHLTLNSQFTSTLRIDAENVLVTTGPYRLIQHPIYVSFFVLFLSTGLFTRSWLIGALGALTIGTLMTTRRVREESMLADRFGDEYEEYRRQTGRFIPRVRRFRTEVGPETLHRRDTRP